MSYIHNVHAVEIIQDKQEQNWQILGQTGIKLDDRVRVHKQQIKDPVKRNTHEQLQNAKKYYDVKLFNQNS